MLYCCSCGVYAYRNHKCSIVSLIPLSRECRGIADKTYALGLELLSAGCFVAPVRDSLYEHHITIDLEFRHDLPPILDLPPKWTHFTEIVGTDFQISAIGYSETFVWIGIKSPQERAQQIANDFSVYLSTLDKFSLTAIRTLYNT